MEELLLSSYSRGIRKSTYWVTNGGPLSFPLTYCRQRSNMETDASPNTLPTCSTFSNKHFLLECLMKGPIIWNMKMFTGFSWDFQVFFMALRPWKCHWFNHENPVKNLWIYNELFHEIFMGFDFIVIVYILYKFA